jgi:hypothetical protein
MNTAPGLLHALDELLVEDDKQLRHLRAQTDEAHAAFDDLMARLRREIESARGPAGATHLRG